MEGSGWHGFAAPLSNAHPRLAGTLLLRPLHVAAVLAMNTIFTGRVSPMRHERRAAGLNPV